ncbi:hypothetical protein TUM20983_55140 [Mycobacterium antarcticum]|uniref:hypothetical protein n=1 Tax=unclassified Mycolicibacterium TaxID=2636767 RepID=UPI00239F8731|nr:MULTISPECIES: hypothetical protein [unclassified Mycolicibacterium]GLP78404.1 hypothetical protein TUM20983_55140 [Mycolicibacterium sp. TUM20983]GLP81457.1 hypothetical protein TUM20984_28770 [Mycolicibacterium sp. TUM20984]
MMMTRNRGFVTACAAAGFLALGVGATGGTPAGASPATMPASATYIADLPGGPGSETMTVAITMRDDDVVAYATNGTNEDAYFLGTYEDDGMHLMSIYGDVLKASFDGTNIAGEVTMNEANSVPAKLTAVRVGAPAGIYTAAMGTSRATYVVRPDRSVVGVMDNSAPGDHRVTDAIMANEDAFKDSVRQMRLDRSASRAPSLNTDTMEGEMGGQRFRAVAVTGDMSL